MHINTPFKNYEIIFRYPNDRAKTISLKGVIYTADVWYTDVLSYSR